MVVDVVDHMQVLNIVDRKFKILYFISKSLSTIKQ